MVKHRTSNELVTFWLDSEEVEVVDSAVTMDANRVKVPMGPGGGK